MLTVVLLVTMRLAIGCHFFYEGVWKIKHADDFSAEPFLTMAKGPAAPLFYAMVYDLNGRERLKVEDVATADDLVASWRKVRDDSEMRYRAYLEKAAREKLNLDKSKPLPKNEQEPIDKAVGELRQNTSALFWEHKAKLEEYLEGNEKEMAAYFAADKRESDGKLRTWLSKLAALEEDYFEALKDYGEQKEQLARDAVGRSLAPLVPKLDKNTGPDRLVVDRTRPNAEGRRVVDASICNLDEKKVIVHVGPGIKGEITLAQWDDLRRDVVRKYNLSEQQQANVRDVYRRYEATLKTYLADRTEEIAGYFGSLDRFEAEEAAGNNGAAFQKQRGWNRMMRLRSEAKAWLVDVEEMDRAYRDALWQALTPEQRRQGHLPVATTRGDFLDFAVTWGLTAIGLCVLVGFCTRLACLGGAAFLVSVLLTQPPWPTIFPPAPEVVGHALGVDKNFVEMVALLVLASTAVGRWGGLDHFVYRYLGEPLLKRLNKPKKQAGERDESDS